MSTKDPTDFSLDASGNVQIAADSSSSGGYLTVNANSGVNWNGATTTIGNTTSWPMTISQSTTGWDGTWNLGGQQYENRAAPILNEMMEKIKSLPQDKLDAMGIALKKTITSYRAIDKALNIVREIDAHDDLLALQEEVWDVISKRVGYKRYDIRDAIWGAMLATLVKNDLTNKEFNTLILPYGLIAISAP